MDKFVFTGIVLQDGDSFLSICPELDVVSQGETTQQAKELLLEAASLHLEGSFEEGLPYYRPIPPEEDPRQNSPESITDIFHLKVDIAIRAYV